ncbi:MAG: tol-pal system protein YbgF [Acidobacteria bacterium]|nr:tol-pal system protein YbgF [Acidobacteriota bacterium]
MKKHALSVALVVALLAAGVEPALAQKKDTLLLMRQLDTLQQMILNMQKTLDTQTAVLRTLVEQTNDNVNSMKTIVADLQKATQQSLASNNAQFDSMTSQIQTLSESLEEAKARIARLSEQVAQTQNIIQTLHAPPLGTGEPGAAGSPTGATAVPPSIPDAQTLYKSGLSYFNGGQYPLAVQAFQEYLQYYGESDLASNAQFYIGECYYSQGDFSQAVDEYNKCLERYPKGNKQAAAQLKKGYALLAMEQNQPGVRELRSLIQRFPSSPEADLARQRLKKLGISYSGRRGM